MGERGGCSSDTESEANSGIMFGLCNPAEQRGGYSPDNCFQTVPRDGSNFDDDLFLDDVTCLSRDDSTVDGVFSRPGLRGDLCGAKRLSEVSSVVSSHFNQLPGIDSIQRCV